MNQHIIFFIRDSQTQEILKTSLDKLTVFDFFKKHCYGFRNIDTTCIIEHDLVQKKDTKQWAYDEPSRDFVEIDLKPVKDSGIRYDGDGQSKLF